LRVTWKIKTAVCLAVLGGACWFGGSSALAQDEPNEALLQMVVTLVSDADRDMRALGLQQIREEVPGEAATKRFAGLLPELSSEPQAELLGALGDRGDPAAKPAVLEMLDNEQDAVRAAALGALGALGGSGDVPLLAKRTARGSDAEKAAARAALVRLRGEDVNEAVASAMDDAGPEVHAALLGVLAARNAKGALPKVMASTRDRAEGVRLAALSALRYLADVDDTPKVIDALGEVQSDAERRKAELALLSVCSRGGEECVEELLAAFPAAEAPTQVVLLHALARAGGEKALAAIVDEGLSDDDQAVRDEAVRMLSRWPAPAAIVTLVGIAESGEGLRHKVLALRGVVRLASEQEPPDLDVLGQAFELAPRPEEKRLVLGALGGVGTPEALSLVVPLLEDATVGEEAALAAITIAGKIKEEAAAEARAALEKVLVGPADEEIRERAKKVLDSL